MSVASTEFLRRLSRMLCLLGLLAGFAHAQAGAAVTFTLDFPQSDPPHYAVSVSSDRKAAYNSPGKPGEDGQSDNSFRLDFEMSAANCQRVFDLASRSHYFEGNIDSTKKLAFTGTKTLAYKDARISTSAGYNYSPVQAVQELTTLFQSISATLEFGHRLEYFHRYQKLALDDEIKRMDDMAKSNDLQELSAVVPILQSIADDQSVINPVRTRARRLINQAAAKDKVGTSPK